MPPILKAWLLLVCLQTLAACGGGSSGSFSTSPPPPPPPPEFLFATATNGANEVLSFTINPSTGELSSPTTIAGPDIGVPVANPTANYLYVSDTYSNDQVYAYSINPATGNLSDLPGSPFVFSTSSGTGILFGIAVDPSGKFLYYDHGSPVGIGGAEINSSNGSLSNTSYLFVPATTQILGTAFDLAGKFLFAGNLSDSSGDDFFLFSVDPSTGVLAQIPGSPFTLDPNSEPYSVAVHPSGKFLYAALFNFLSAQTSGIAAMTIDPNTEALSLISGSPFSPGKGFQHIAIHQSGNFLYAISSDDNNVYAFGVDPASGVLTPVSNSPFATGAVPLSLAFDSSGKFLMVANFVDGTITVFSVNASSGSLTPVKGSPFAAGIPVGYLATAQAH